MYVFLIAAMSIKVHSMQLNKHDTIGFIEMDLKTSFIGFDLI